MWGFEHTSCPGLNICCATKWFDSGRSNE